MTSLINAGKEITDRSILYIGLGLGASGASAAISAIPVVGQALGGIVGGISKLLFLFGVIGFGIGLILYFLLPVFPFIYLFFAVTSWVMEIFEAVIAMPLWALAHLRIDGDGMPGQAAMNGYFLLLSILIRPALIVMGLMAGVLVFSGAIYLLQTLFRDVILIKSGGSASGIEILIYAIIFAYICYISAINSFKLVDLIPNQILRWIGSGTPTFSDNREDAIGGNNQMALAAAGIVGGQMAGGLSEVAGGLGQAAGKGAQATASKLKGNNGLPPIPSMDAMESGSDEQKSTSSSGGDMRDRAKEARDNKPRKKDS
jgi:hypothetical protein